MSSIMVRSLSNMRQGQRFFPGKLVPAAGRTTAVCWSGAGDKFNVGKSVTHAAAAASGSGVLVPYEESLRHSPHDMRASLQF